MLLAGCYGRASPETCHAKYIRDQRGEYGDYERCLARYESRQRASKERQLGLRPSRSEIAAQVMLGVVAAMAASDPPTYGTQLRCADGWYSSCIVEQESYQGCCSHHGGIP
jgi:hypothetical protein